MKDWFPFAVLLGIIAIALFGGAKNSSFVLLQPPQNTGNTQYQNGQTTTPDPNISTLKDNVDFQLMSYSNNPDQEYIAIDASSNNTNPINITGWKIKNSITNFTVTIPRSTYLYISGDTNPEQDVVLKPGERAYIITGKSPIGFGMHLNICSGYLSQFNNFNPGVYTSCPTPRNEASTTIPRSPVNNNCLDLVDSTSACTTRTTALNNSYSGSCQQLFSNTLTYQGCVNAHQRDADFYSPKYWYVYLKRSESLWNISRSTITLYDSYGKIIKTINR